ncbi:MULTISPECIES: hypothetical protein [Streptomyces]|uniref:hypothetical protein n=1 Tax=Streptomyces TaxID=1883 RepID=UPI001F16D1E6|nr:hypothetical protein [Streptomyces noursei]MCE4945301.1 hypothetical protein [Streptomyces noursei]
MSDSWPTQLAPELVGYLEDLHPPVQEMVRDVLAIASRSPWSWPQWDRTESEGENVRRASIGSLTVVYWVNRSRGHLRVIDMVWAG